MGWEGLHQLLVVGLRIGLPRPVLLVDLSILWMLLVIRNHKKRYQVPTWPRNQLFTSDMCEEQLTSPPNNRLYELILGHIRGTTETG